MQLYLVRHGETQWNKEYRYYGSTDISLNERGEEQAKKVGDLLKNVSFDTIYTSTLQRARKTEELIMAKQKRKESKKETVIASDLLREQDLGKFEGYTYQELQQQFPEEVKQWSRDYKSAPHGGESFHEMYERVYQFCTELLEINGIPHFSTNHERTITPIISDKPNERELRVPKERENEKVLVVSHMAVLRCFFTLLLGMPEDAVWNFTLEQGAYSMIDIEDGVAIIRKINQSLVE